MEDDLVTLVNVLMGLVTRVLCHHWIIFDTHKLNFDELLFDDHLPSMEDDGR